MSIEGPSSNRYISPRRNLGTEAVPARLDSRGRLNLKPFDPVSDTFLVDVNDDGRITLTPLQVMTVSEARELRRLRDERTVEAGEVAPNGGEAQ